MFAPATDDRPKPFGMTIDTPQQKAGVVTVFGVQDLVKDCQCVGENGKPIQPQVLPWQGFATVNKERWCLRVEPPGFHELHGENVFGCAWSFALAGSETHPDR